MNYLKDINVIKVLKDPVNDWQKIVSSSVGNKRVAFRKLDVNWKEFTQDKYLFTHNTIVSSVETEKDGFTIKDPCHELVNANGNSWTNSVLAACFKTFIGKPVYQEHIECLPLAKGTILDAVARPVVYVGSNSKKANVLYIDLLVATERSHTKLVYDIENGKMSSMSMGVSVNLSVCSVCGKKITDDKYFCDHLKNHLGDWVTYKGKKKFCAELIGACDSKGNFIEDSCEFIEASWVEDPAFVGAELNYFIEDDSHKKLRIDDLKYFNTYIDLDYLSKLRVANRYSKCVLGVLKSLVKKEDFDNSVNNVFNKLK